MPNTGPPPIFFNRLLELFNADEPVPVEACRVYLTNVGGQWHWSAQAADWVNLMTDRDEGQAEASGPSKRDGKGA